MPRTTIPLVGAMTARGNEKTIGTSSKDQQYINCLFEVAENPQTGSKNVYCIKRAGSTSSQSINTEPTILRNYTTDFGPLLYIDNSSLYSGTTNLGSCGAIGLDRSAADSIMNGKTVIVFSDVLGNGYYCYYDATTTNFTTFTGNRLSGSAVIDNIASTTGIYAGQNISGTGIPASTRVLSVDSSTQITMTANATSGAPTSTTITKEAVAKIATFPSNVVSMEAMDGYAFAGTSDGKIYNSNINDPYTWGTSNYLSVDFGSDRLIRIFKIGDTIIALGTNTIQAFKNTGNSSGSVLSVVKSYSMRGMFFAAALGTNPTRVLYYNGFAYALARMGAPNGALALVRFNSSGGVNFIYSDIPSGIIFDASLFILGLMLNGDKTVILIHSTSATNIIAYDPTNNGWSVINTSVAITSAFGVVFTQTGLPNEFQWALTNTWQDNGSAYTMTIQTEPWVLNKGRGVFIRSIDVIADTQSSGSGTLSISTDDYASFPASFTIDWTKHLKRCWPRMTARSGHMIVKLTDSGNNAWRGSALVVDWEPCDI